MSGTGGLISLRGHTGVMMVEADESFQEEDREKTDDDPQRDIPDRVTTLDYRTRMECFGQEIENGKSEHHPSHE